MSTRCTWKTYNGAHCPFPATSTGLTYGPKRWLCGHHVECRNGRAGDLIVFNEINRRKAIEKAKDSGAVDPVAKVQKMRANALQRNLSTGRSLYDEGWNRARGRGVDATQLHDHACAYIVQEVSSPGVKTRSAVQ